jgi:RNA polymerase sigma-70 factor, ECF subfamily
VVVSKPAEVRGAEPAASEVAAVSALYRDNYEFVWRNARRLGCGDEWLDDAVHEIFLVAARRLAEFEGRSSPHTWLFAITFRVVQRMRRDRGRQKLYLSRYVETQPVAWRNPEHEREAAQYLRYLLALLPSAQRLVFILAELEGFTSSEIAQTLSLPLGTVHSRLRSAKQRLTRIIEEDSQSPERPKP